MLKLNLRKLLGARILSEANDLKRTIPALAKELGMEEKKVQDIVEGKSTIQEARDLITRMGETYPIDPADLYVVDDGCTNGVKIMRNEESRASERVFSRLDREGKKTPYYAYRDTAMTPISPFKPEWIKELRLVNDADPTNPDIAYNNGHFLHQMTFFIGPVNFYWKVNGKCFGREMNTGDSNYITPFCPHSFASRDKTQDAVILAVTFGGEVRRAQKEIYSLGEQRTKSYQLDYRNTAKASTQLILQHAANENLTPELFTEKIKLIFPEINIENLLDEKKEKTMNELTAVARCLGIELSELLISSYCLDEEVVVKHSQPSERLFYPNNKQKDYLINSLAQSSKMSLMKGFNIEVLTNNKPSMLFSSLHEYLFNYGNAEAVVYWFNDNSLHQDILRPGDSMYLKAFTRYGFANVAGVPAKLCAMRVSGAVTTAAQKELSFFADLSRIVENKCWFS